jgi:hypothetical protein
MGCLFRFSLITFRIVANALAGSESRIAKATIRKANSDKREVSKEIPEADGADGDRTHDLPPDVWRTLSQLSYAIYHTVVEVTGIEPATSSLRTMRSPS